jgi:flagellar basal body P-ring protein FlgI
MKHLVHGLYYPRFLRLLGAMVLVGLTGLAGCIELPTHRGQSAEESERDKDLDIRTIGDITTVSNAGALPISGVGLVTHLSGTGGGSPPGYFRKMLEDQLLKQDVRNVKALLDAHGVSTVKQLLDAPDCAMVMLTAVIVPGSRKGDLIDIDVTLPDGSKVTSLRGGILEHATLVDYANARDINPAKGDNLLKGHVLAHASGPVVVGMDGNDEPGHLRKGRVWSGGVSHIDRPFFLVLNNDQKFARVANAVASRINVMVQDDPKKRLELNHRLLVLNEVTEGINHQFAGRGQTTMAVAHDKEVVNVFVPYAYRLNPERFLRVVRLMPLQNDPKKEARYKDRLEKMLLDPKEAVRAALRLEALGKDSVLVLKHGLGSENALVRFSAAEALAYLGSTMGCEQLARLAEQHSILRAYCLLAMTSLEEGICKQHLEEMLASPDAELRCGAFQALRQMPDSDRALNARLLGRAFWLHQVAPDSRPLVFFTMQQRAEIVLFGSDTHFVPPVKILAGPEFVVTSEPGDDRCTVSRFQTADGSVQRKQCSLRLRDVLSTVVELGGQYPDAIQLLSKAEEYHCLSCPVCFRTLPEMVSVQTLADGGKDPNFLK